MKLPAASGWGIQKIINKAFDADAKRVRGWFASMK